MDFTDTHCHIHEADYGLSADTVIGDAEAAGVTKLICVGTDLKSSRLAVEFVRSRPQCWASIGLHPHDAKLGNKVLTDLKNLLHHKNTAYKVRPCTGVGCVGEGKIVAIGECGLDYFYSHSPKEDQVRALQFQIELAQEYNLPLIFHIRDAFVDFWPIFDSYKGLRGVVHSFTATEAELGQILDRGLYVGLNGIMTFTKRAEQLTAARAVPLRNLLLETDAPFLTPIPYRGKINQSAYLVEVAKFLANLRGESLEDLARSTTKNAAELFGL